MHLDHPIIVYSSSSIIVELLPQILSRVSGYFQLLNIRLISLYVVAATSQRPIATQAINLKADIK